MSELAITGAVQNTTWHLKGWVTKNGSPKTTIGADTITLVIADADTKAAIKTYTQATMTLDASSGSFTLDVPTTDTAALNAEKYWIEARLHDAESGDDEPLASGFIFVTSSAITT